MIINKQSLLDNGWELGQDGLLTKFVRNGLQLWASHDHRAIFLESQNDGGHRRTHLPALALAGHGYRAHRHGDPRPICGRGRE